MRAENARVPSPPPTEGARGRWLPAVGGNGGDGERNFSCSIFSFFFWLSQKTGASKISQEQRRVRIVWYEALHCVFGPGFPLCPLVFLKYHGNVGSICGCECKCVCVPPSSDDSSWVVEDDGAMARCETAHRIRRPKSPKNGVDACVRVLRAPSQTCSCAGRRPRPSQHLPFRRTTPTDRKPS